MAYRSLWTRCKYRREKKENARKEAEGAEVGGGRGGGEGNEDLRDISQLLMAVFFSIFPSFLLSIHSCNHFFTAANSAYLFPSSGHLHDDCFITLMNELGYIDRRSRSVRQITSIKEVTIALSAHQVKLLDGHTLRIDTAKKINSARTD